MPPFWLLKILFALRMAQPLVDVGCFGFQAAHGAAILEVTMTTT